VQLTITMGEGVAHVDGVAQRDGKPAAGVMILMIPEFGQDLEQDSRRDQSDSDGTFTLANILPGKYVLMAIENGWDLEWMNPSVLKPYRERGITLPLAPHETRKMTVEVQRASRDDNSQKPDNTDKLLASMADRISPQN
jgi:hypothetical protein